MAWDATGGFTTGVPWIAGDGSHVEVNVALQEGDPDSVLEWHRALIALRRSSRALVYGETITERSSRRVWRYRRRAGEEEFLVVLNLSDRPARLRAPAPAWKLECASGPGTGPLAPYQARVWRSSAGL
jgi:glycosidase